MRTIDESETRRHARRERAVRDLRLLRRIAGLLVTYATTGGRVRRRYRSKESRGEVLFVDEELPH